MTYNNLTTFVRIPTTKKHILKIADQVHLYLNKLLFKDNPSKRTLLTIVLLLCLFPLISQDSFPFTSVHGSTKESLKIHVKNETGEKSFLSTHMPKGKIHLVSVWATWCGPCRSELNAIQKVHCDWTEKYDFEFIAISIDAPKDYSKIYNMANKVDWNFKILHDEYGYLVRELEISKLPRLFLVDQKGNIIYEPKGYSTRELEKIEEKILALTLE